MGIVPCNNVFMSHNMNMLTDVTAGVICLQRGLQLSQLLPVKFRDCILHDCDASRWSHIGVICHYNRCPGAHFAMMTTRTDEVKTLPADAVADVKNGRDKKKKSISDSDSSRKLSVLDTLPCYPDSK